MDEKQRTGYIASAFADVPKPPSELVYNVVDSLPLDCDSLHGGLAGKDWNEVSLDSAVGVRPDLLLEGVYRYYVQSQLLVDFGLGAPGIGPEEAGLTRWETAAKSDAALIVAASAPPIPTSTEVGRLLSDAFKSIPKEYASPAAYWRRCRFGNSTYPPYFEIFERILSDMQLRAVAKYVRFFSDRADEKSTVAFEEYWSRFDVGSS